MGKFRYDIAILRLLAIIIVVFFHAYGMMYADHFSPETKAIYHSAYYNFNQFCPINVAMPLFVFISGFLFGSQLINNNLSLKKVIRNKAQRLLLPFAVFTILFMFTQNAVSWKPLYQWNYSHLWFLPMLFWCFIITYLIKPLIFSERPAIYIPLLLSLFAISLPEFAIPKFLGLHNVNEWLCWFVGGAWFYKHEHLLASRKARINVTIWGGLSYIIISILWPEEYVANTINGEVASLLAIITLWAGVNLIPWHKINITEFIVKLSSYSFGIYIFHNWLEAHMISRTAQRIFHLEQLAHDHTILFPLTFAIVAFILSLILTRLLRQTRLTRHLL